MRPRSCPEVCSIAPGQPCPSHRFSGHALRGSTRAAEEPTESAADWTPTEATVAKLKETKVWKMENEFYQFAHSHFNMLKEELSEIARFRAKFGTERLYHYEKIRPLKP